MLSRIHNILKPIYFKFKRILIIYSVLTLTGTVANILTPYILINYLSPDFSVSTLSLWLIVCYGLGWSVARIIPHFRNKLFIPINIYFSNYLSGKIANHFYSLPLDYQLSTPAGKVSLLITKCYYSSTKLIPSGLGSIVPTIVEALSATIILTYLYGPIGLGQIGILVLYSIFSMLNARKISTAKQKEIEQGFTFVRHYQSAFNNYENVHYFNNINHELNNFSKEANLFAQKMEQSFNLIENSSLQQAIILGVGFTGIILLTSVMLAQGIISISDFFIINLYSTQFSLTLNNFSSSISDLQTSITDTEKIIDFFNEGTEINENSNAPRLLIDSNNATIQFRNVSFAYKDKLILNNVSFDVKTGQKVAIIGLSGEGKSTILKLLFRFYEVTSGDILINKQNIKEVTLSSLRASVAIIPQNPILFNSSILENIRYGYLKASISSIKQAANYAGLSSFITQQPQGFNTIVGEYGSKISGGQKQRIAIARAILKNAPIFLFDEATSSLDVTTEREVQQSLDYVSSGHTTLIITHRLTTITNADNIIYLKNGSICEQGTYQELIELHGVFYQQISEYCKNLGVSIDGLKEAI